MSTPDAVIPLKSQFVILGSGIRLNNIFTSWCYFFFEFFEKMPSAKENNQIPVYGILPFLVFGGGEISRPKDLFGEIVTRGSNAESKPNRHAECRQDWPQVLRFNLGIALIVEPIPVRLDISEIENIAYIQKYR